MSDPTTTTTPTNTTTTTTTTTNITKNNIQGKCDLKCAYTFKYPISGSTLTNKGIYLSLSYDATSMAPVTYNAQPYLVSQINIYAPSLHLFNGSTTTAEIIVLHSPKNGGDNLYVSIPILVNGGNTTSASSIISQIIDQASTSAPAEDDSVALSITNFSLNDIIPSKIPFYSYTGNNVNDSYMSPWIVYGYNSAIAITQDDADKLTKIITPFSYGLTGDVLFINGKGANSLPSDQTVEVYISCEPTNTSDDEVMVSSTSKNPTIFNWGDAFKNPVWKTIIQILIAFTICITVYWLIYMGYNNFIGGGKTSTSTSTSTSSPKQTGGYPHHIKHVHFSRPISRIKKI